LDVSARALAATSALDLCGSGVLLEHESPREEAYCSRAEVSEEEAKPLRDWARVEPPKETA